ncbi:hypothetical protein PybrP1_009481 [[Pythium] brassicae (nom. inval.)]|nr:hypothetical protein PybrP1_009481 [[Pythium] brassicae (nom. inval.)]
MDAPPSPHSSAVSGLMQQLKSGEISKMQLFQEIAKLQAKSASLNNPPGATPIVESDAEFLASGVSHDKAQRFSVQEWMASKQRGSSAASQLSHAAAATGSQDTDAYGGANQSKEDGRYEYNPQRMLNHQQPAPYSQDSENRCDPPSPNEQEFIDFTEHFRDDLDNEAAADGGGGHTGNLAGKAAKIAGSSSNNASSGGDDAFHARVTRWKSQKDAIREQMKQQLLQSELDECTFAPKVNPKSTKVAAKLRTRQGSAKEYTSSPLAVSERLYQEADNYKAREELAQRVKAEEEADLERECTFKPKINRATALTDKVKAKYMDVQKNPSPSLTAAAMESTAKELEQCTFFPKVNPIGTEMVSAQLYLQQDIYERLSRPCGMTANDSPARSGRLRRRAGSLTDDEFRCDTDSDLASSLTSPRRSQDDCYIRSLSPRRRRSLVASGREPRSAGKQRQQRPRSADGIRTDEDKAERARQLDGFLERQQFHEDARRKKIEATTQHLLPTHKPTINKKSLGMMENGRKGDFLERITKYALRKEHDSVKNKSVRVSDPNCTFKPTINQTSTKRKGRSVTELSRGDLLRRETTQRLMKLKMEQEEMAALTFRPQLNRVSERHEGKLKILTSPDTYLQRIQQQTHAHTIKQRRAVQEKELEEFAECTFKPRTIEAPAYVQRIARSMSLTKALRQQQLAATRAGDKPEWK